MKQMVMVLGKLNQAYVAFHTTNMAKALLDYILKRGWRGEMCPFITVGDHLVISPLR